MGLFKDIDYKFMFQQTEFSASQILIDLLGKKQWIVIVRFEV